MILEASVTTSSFRAEWSAPSHDVTGYEVTVTSSAGNSVSSQTVTQLFAEFSGLTAGDVYTVEVKSKISDGQQSASISEMVTLCERYFSFQS